jgi:hypothetical protein
MNPTTVEPSELQLPPVQHQLPANLKVSWFWPVIDSQYVADVVLRRAAWFGYANAFYMLVAVIATTYGSHSFARAYAGPDQAWIYVDVVMAAGSSYLMQYYYSRTAGIFLIQELIGGDLLWYLIHFGFPDSLLSQQQGNDFPHIEHIVLSLLLMVPAIHATFAYHRRSRMAWSS